MPSSPLNIKRSELLKLNDVGDVNTAVNGISAVVTGDGPCRQVILTFTDVPVTLADNGNNGSGGVKVYTFAKGVTHLLGASGKLTVSYGSVTDANLIGSVGSAAAGADGTLTSTEANLVPSTSCATTAGTGTLTAKSTTSGVVLDGTVTPVDLYVNFATSSDPGTNNSITFSGKLVFTYISHGDAASIS